MTATVVREMVSATMYKLGLAHGPDADILSVAKAADGKWVLRARVGIPAGKLVLFPHPFRIGSPGESSGVNLKVAAGSVDDTWPLWPPTLPGSAKAEPKKKTAKAAPKPVSGFGGTCPSEAGDVTVVHLFWASLFAAEPGDECGESCTSLSLAHCTVEIPFGGFKVSSHPELKPPRDQTSLTASIPFLRNDDAVEAGSWIVGKVST